MTKRDLNDLIRQEANKETNLESSVISANLPARIDELTEALKIANEKAKSWQDQVTSLKADLKQFQQSKKQESQLQTRLAEQTTLVEQLSSQLSQAETELEARKQLIEKLYEHIQTLENLPTTTTEPPKPASKKLSLYNFETRTLNRYVAPIATPTTLNDADIGWFD